MLPISVARFAGSNAEFAGGASLRPPSWITSGLLSFGSVGVSPGNSSSGVGSRGSSGTSLLPGSWRLVRGRLAADAEASEFLVRVAEGFEGEIEPSHSINCSREPVISKLFCANRRRRTSLLSPESSMRWSISYWREKRK